MAYLENAWYAAAWSKEVEVNRFLARTYLDIPVALFRNEAGEIVAMHDRCPHRFAPLSMGQIVDGAVRCGYHGLSFDQAGNCIKNLFSPVAPKAAKVRVYPVHEQDKMIWIWMGESEPDDPAKIPRLPHQTDPEMRCVFGLTTAKADYRLLSDNLMDLTHTALLHPSFGGLDYIPQFKSWEEDQQVVSRYIIEHMPSFIGEPGSTIHNHDEIRWIAPSTHILESRITPDDGSNHITYIPSAHILTPETAKSTHYFWSSAMAADTPMSDEDMYAQLVQAFDHEDKPMVEAVQRRMGDAELWDLDPILIATDAGSVRMRRILAAMIEREQAAKKDTPESTSVPLHTIEAAQQAVEAAAGA
jgi:vanillate O-demethylase monooxygenase subunit